MTLHLVNLITREKSLKIFKLNNPVLRRGSIRKLWQCLRRQRMSITI
uniref:Uncharacterized protein n=1 Tax=Arundo donax TaxID=35708 RepID=A0A0A9E171_ARUDO